jgi:hypothetical protein
LISLAARAGCRRNPVFSCRDAATLSALFSCTLYPAISMSLSPSALISPLMSHRRVRKHIGNISPFLGDVGKIAPPSGHLYRGDE